MPGDVAPRMAADEVLSVSPPGGAAGVVMAAKTASLTVLGGPFAGTRCALPESGTVTVGSAEGSTLRLDLPTVSPCHACIEVESGRVIVHDTGAERALHVN